MYRAEALSVTEIVTLDTKSSQALDTLQRMFPYFVTLAAAVGPPCDSHCHSTEKQHWMTHWGDNYHIVNSIRNGDDAGDQDQDEVGCQDQGVQDQPPGPRPRSARASSRTIWTWRPPWPVELSRHVDETGSPTVSMLGLHQVCLFCGLYGPKSWV